MLASLARGKPARLIERTLPLAEFFVAYRQTALRPGEMLKTIRVPRGAGQLISAGRDSRPRPTAPGNPPPEALPSSRGQSPSVCRAARRMDWGGSRGHRHPRG